MRMIPTAFIKLALDFIINFVESRNRKNCNAAILLANQRWQKENNNLTDITMTCGVKILNPPTF